MRGFIPYKFFHIRNQFTRHRLPVAIQHPAVVSEEQVVLDPREARALTTLDHDHVLSVIRVQNRHPVNRAVRVSARNRVHHVVCTDHQRHVRSFELFVDLVQIVDDVIRHARFRQQYVHVPRHPPCNRVNRKFHGHAAFLQLLGHFPNLVLRLRHRHAVTGDDDDLFRKRHHDGSVWGFNRFHRAGDFLRFARGFAEIAEQARW